jgi:biopolymer transport protein ExbD
LDAANDKDRMVVVEVGEDVAYERYFQIVTMVAEAGGIVAMLTD